MATPARTLGALRRSGYQPLSVRDEIRKNLVTKLRKDEPLFSGIAGYDETVLPALVNAILAGQDIIFLGERGQAKSRLIRSLASLLDESIPVLDGPEIPEDPFAPISQAGKELVATAGDDALIRWMSADERYGEKLATPDITIADLIGEVDPIKVAEGRYLSDEMTIHYGLVPRTNRGIFSINELPDLAERIQVGLLNIMEERDVQIRGFRVRIPLDIFIVASANPEDYTNRGRIITPLKDRYGAQIRTHYPKELETEVAIMRQEAHSVQIEGMHVEVPDYMDEIVAEVTPARTAQPGCEPAVWCLRARDDCGAGDARRERCPARHPAGRKSRGPADHRFVPHSSRSAGQGGAGNGGGWPGRADHREADPRSHCRGLQPVLQRGRDGRDRRNLQERDLGRGERDDGVQSLHGVARPDQRLTRGCAAARHER